MIKIKRILVPTDFSEQGHAALEYAVALADRFCAAVDLLHVVEPVPPGALMGRIPLEDLKADMNSSAQEQLAELHSAWDDYAFPVRRLVVDGHPFVQIIQHARDINADLIVMGTHGRGAIAHMLLGSVAEKVVRKAACPVLTVRHPEHTYVHP